MGEKRVVVQHSGGGCLGCLVLLVLFGVVGWAFGFDPRTSVRGGLYVVLGVIAVGVAGVGLFFGGVALFGALASWKERRRRRRQWEREAKEE